MLDHLKLDSDVVVTAESDSLGRRVFESGVYDFTISLAYLDQSKTEATSVNLVMNTADGRELKLTEYVTSGKAKGCKPYYMDKDGKKQPLPGYSKMNDMFKHVTGVGIDAQQFEKKIIKLYDFDQKKEMPVEKPILVNLLGQKIVAGVQEVKEVHYSDESKIVSKNEVAKWFDGTTRQTTAEKEQQADASFVTKWADTFAGKVNDKTKKGGNKAGAATPAATAPASGSLFN